MGEHMVSVVVPIYGVERYLRKCVDSLLQQTYKNIEIILVDDGSPDACPEICDELKNVDNRIVVIHKKNGGLSDARNAGIQIANGTYITFIDSDDYVGIHYIETLVKAIEDCNASVSICDYINVYDDMGIEREKSICNIFSNKECIEKIYHPVCHGMEFVAWGKLYKTSLFKNNVIMYPVGKIHEDTFTTYKLLYYAERIAYVDYVGYFYRQRENSIMSSTFNTKNLSMVEATREACEFFSDNNEKYLFNCAVNSHFKTYISTFSEVLKNKKGIGDYKKVKNDLLFRYHEDIKHYLDSSDIGAVHKVYYRLFEKAPALVAAINRLF